MTWAAQEFGTVDLADKRLSSRLVKLAEQLAAKPTVGRSGGVRWLGRYGSGLPHAR